MDQEKIGKLIYKLRKENNFTQKELAEKMNISDKTISKWERGYGCPDVSLLNELSSILKVNLKNLLDGELNKNNLTIGNMKKMKFYVCETCNNLIIGSNEASIYCCGKKLEPKELNKATDTESLCIDKIEHEFYITSNHEMSKEHFITFIAFVTGDCMILKKLYPEWNLEVRIPFFSHGMLIWYCNRDGLFYQLI